MIQRSTILMVLLLAGMLVAACSNSETETAQPFVRDCSVTLSFHAPEGMVPSYVLARGDIPGGDAGIRLKDADGDGWYEAQVSPPPGRYRYYIYADEQRYTDPRNVLSVLDEHNDEYSLAVVPDCSAGAMRLLEHSITDGAMYARVAVDRAASGAPVDPQTLKAVTNTGVSLRAERESETGYVLLGADALPMGKHTVTITGKDTGGVALEPLSFQFWVEDEPFDWRDAIIYQVMIDRFRQDGQSPVCDSGITHYCGGDVAGVTSAIEDGYFASMGVNVLWISPLYDNPAGEYPGYDGERMYEGYHGYWPEHSRGLEEHFGNEAEVQALVDAAHRKGIRVLMDLVPNHVHTANPLYLDHSQDPLWFNHPEQDCICGSSCSWGDDIEECWFNEYLADMRWGSLPVIDQQCDDALWWYERFDFDGFRIDAVPMMPRLAVYHLRHRLNAAVGAAGEIPFLLGECFTGGQLGRDTIRWYLGPQGLDSLFDFPLMWSLQSILGKGEGSMADLDREMALSEQSYDAPGAVMGLFVDNHDIPRFLSIAAGDDVSDAFNPPPQPQMADPYRRLMMALTVAFTLRGAPILYYGDEVGLAGAGDPDNRRPLPREADLSALQQDVLQHSQTLGSLRAQLASLRRGGWVSLKAEANRLAYLRDSGDGCPAVIALNRSQQATSLDIQLPEAITLNASAMFDAFGQPVQQQGRNITVVVPPLGSAVLYPVSCVSQ